MMEPLLFSIYGKENIIRQRPYEVYLINGFWYLAGTLPDDMLGGTFELIVEAQNGRVVELTHGK
ncbi:NTF2 fold immunity protein [Hymenobacter psychrophilus]|uniref:NTF2 fold immunity protein n=2 Tax=Hymenobacter psychrophilus TaxID=651662 RepID=A0A1H3N1Z4_9BACT|nr:NTF2 fold immunity protein [Hymenobacter psychrophilus]